MKKEKPVKVSLTQKEIQRAVLIYVAGQGINLKGKDVTVEFTATRSRETGIIADLTINDNATDDDFIPAAPSTVKLDDTVETKREESSNLFAATPASLGDDPRVAHLLAETVEPDTLAEAAVEKSAPAEVQVEEAKEAAPAATTGESLFG